MLTEPVVCLVNLVLRENVASMGCLDCQEKKVIGAILDLRDLWDPQEKTERGEVMETLDPVDSLVNQVSEVCLDPKAHLVFLAHMV